jgi:hypothetical protein
MYNRLWKEGALNELERTNKNRQDRGQKPLRFGGRFHETESGYIYEGSILVEHEDMAIDSPSRYEEIAHYDDWNEIIIFLKGLNVGASQK